MTSRKIILVFILGVIGACTVESDPRALPVDFSKRALRYSAAWSKKSITAKFREGGSACVTMIEGCLCDIRQTTADGKSLLYEKKVCIVGSAADANYFRLGFNCFTPVDEDSAKRCKSDSGSLTAVNCTDSNNENQQALIFRMGFVEEPDPASTQLVSATDFSPSPAPDPSQSPVPVADSFEVSADLDLCTQ